MSKSCQLWSNLLPSAASTSARLVWPIRRGASDAAVAPFGTTPSAAEATRVVRPTAVTRVKRVNIGLSLLLGGG